MTKTAQYIKTGRKNMLPVYNPQEMILDRGEGIMLYDTDGNSYIDFTTGIGTNSLGHNHPKLVAVLKEQANKLWHTSNVFWTLPNIELADKLTQATNLAKVFFTNSGAEANEAAIKLARKYAITKYGEQKNKVITFYGSFHGRTLAMITATAQPKYQQNFGPLPQGFIYAKFNDEEEIKALMNDDVCAIMIEPIQGEGGVVPATDNFLKSLRKLCSKYDASLIFDEIQTGIGKTGKLYAFQHIVGLEPDILTTAKALGGGFPIGAMIASEKVGSAMQVGDHGTTFGGNPLATCIAGQVLDIVNDTSFLNNINYLGEKCKAALADINKEYGVFIEIRGKGLMIGAELTKKHHGKAREIMGFARNNGLLILQAGLNVLRLLPPLTITEEEISKSMAILKKSIGEFCKKSQ